MISVPEAQAAFYDDHGIEDPRFLLISVYKGRRRVCATRMTELLTDILEEGRHTGITALGITADDYSILGPEARFWLIAPAKGLTMFLLKYSNLVRVMCTQEEMNEYMKEVSAWVAINGDHRHDCTYILARVALNEKSEEGKIPE